MKTTFKFFITLLLLFSLSLASCAVKPNPPQLTGIAFNDTEFTYDGEDKSVFISGTLPEGVTTQYFGNGVSEVGVYTVTVKFYFNGTYMDGKDLSCTLTIKAADVTPPDDDPIDPPIGNNIDLSHIKFNSASFTYDGVQKEINIIGQLPAGVSVVYKNNGKTNAGVYSVVAEFYLNGNYIAGKDKTATLTINKAVYDMSGIVFSSKNVVYTGLDTSLTISGELPEGVVVKYNKNVYKNAGAYTVIASFDGDFDNYEVIPSMQAFLTIEKAKVDMSGVSLVDKEVVANGEVQGITVTGNLPEGVSVTYTSNKTPIEPGVYLITAVFSVEDPNNFKVPDSLSATLTLTPTEINEDIDLTGISFPDGRSTYDGTEKKHEINGNLPDGVTVEYTVKNNKKLINAGDYEIIAAFMYKGEYIGKTMSSSFIIDKAVYDISNITISDKAVTYNGEAHSIIIGGELPNGVDVVYSGNGQINSGDYKISVIFTVSDLENYESIDKSLEATLTINKAVYDMSGITFVGKTVIYDGNKHNLSISGNLPEGVSVEYSAFDISAVGTYVIKANFKVEDERNYATPSPLEATLIIKPSVTEGLIIQNGVVIGYNGTDAEISIPSSFDNVPVTSIKSNAFMNNTGITSVYIPDTVTNIGNNAFRGCTSLVNVRLSANVTTIGQYAFASCAINYIVLPDTLLSIGYGAYSNTVPVSITLPFIGGSRDSSSPYLCYIFGASDYAGAKSVVPTSLKEVILSDSCDKIPAFAFYGCDSLENVIIGNSVKIINNNAFRGCTSLESIYIPKNVTSIPANAYYHNSPFFELDNDFLIVLEADNSQAYGKYWSMISESNTAITAYGYSYEDYLMKKDDLKNPDPEDAFLNLVSVNGNAIDGFNKAIFEYSLELDVNKPYPEVSVVKSSHVATVSIDQASKDNGGVSTITVTSASGNVTKLYKVVFVRTGTFNSTAEIVNKNGAKGVVTFIFDDGHKDTANALKSIISQKGYDNIKFTFALKTQDLASFADKYGNKIDRWGNATDNAGNLIGTNGSVIAAKGSFTIDSDTGCPKLADGTLITDQKAEYCFDENGNYVFIGNDSNISYWTDILNNTNYSEIFSHTHTSGFWGINDDGGNRII